MDTHTVAKRVSLATVDQKSNEPVNLGRAEMEETPSVNEIVTGSRETSPVPPPGFRPFGWPEVKRMTNGEFQRDPGLKFVASWSAQIAEEERSSPPPLEALSPIPMVTSQDSMTVQVGTTDSEEIHRRRPCRPSSLHTTIVKPSTVEDFLFKNILSEEAKIDRQSVSGTTGIRYCNTVPRWRLAREGPFPNERSQASLRVLGKGCTFRHTTYKWEDHARPEGGLGVPLNHPRFLEWLGAPDWAWLLEMSPGHWCDTLSRDQTMTAATQLHRDACLMQTNLDILDQYALALHGMASKTITEYYWWRSLPWSGSGVGGTRGIRTPSLGANGSTRAVETQFGPITVHDHEHLKNTWIREQSIIIDTCSYCSEYLIRPDISMVHTLQYGFLHVKFSAYIVSYLIIYRMSLGLKHFVLEGVM